MKNITDEMNDFRKEIEVLKLLKHTKDGITFYRECLQKQISINFAVDIKNKWIAGVYD
jgi:hypothetical protein